MRLALLLLPLVLGGAGDQAPLPERYQGLAKSETTRLDRIWGTPEQHVFLMNRVAYTPDGKTALVASTDLAEKDADDFIAVWDLEKSEGTPHPDHQKSRCHGHSAGADGKRAVTATYADAPGKATVLVRYWNLDTGKVIHELKGTSEAIRAVAISQDGKRVLAASMNGPVLLFDIVAGKLLHTLAHKNEIYCVAFSPDGKHALTGGLDDHLHLWALDTGKEMADLFTKQNRVTTVVFLPGGKRAVSVGTDQVPKLWDLSEKKWVHDFKKDPQGNAVTPLALSGDGKRLVSLPPHPTTRSSTQTNNS